MIVALPLLNQTIVVTRPLSENKIITKKLTDLGAKVIQFPTIAIRRIHNSIETRAIVSLREKQYDWIIFTSVNGVSYFFKDVQAYRNMGFFDKTKIAVVGPRTKQRAESLGLQVNFMPTEYNTTTLAQELPNIAGKEILLARSVIAHQGFVVALKARGAYITDIPIYSTIYKDTIDPVFENMVINGKINYITFTSPSTVTGFFKRIHNEQIQQAVLGVPIISIGTVTTEAAQKAGFKKIITAREHTITGMVKKLEEYQIK